MTSIDLVIPTSGRPSLIELLRSIERQGDLGAARVIVVDDRPRADHPLDVPAGVAVLRGRAAGPAAARNRGWRASQADWVAFLDDDVVLTPGWFADLIADLAVPRRVAGSQGRIATPWLRRRPTDAERAVIGLQSARYATADMCYRRDALLAVRGFDERFPRAYREDSDLALRVLRAGWEITAGRRRVVHPFPAHAARTAIRRQAGNRDDVLMRALHGSGWREPAGAPRGRLRRHAAVVAAGAAAGLALAAGRRRTAAAALAAWAAATAEFAWARIAPGPRTPAEVAAMLATSAVIPPLAVYHSAAGLAELPRRLRDRPAAVLFDRDGTLVVDVPYNGDPARVRAMPGAAAALSRLRRAGIPVGVVTNQSGVALGHITSEELRAVNRRVESLLGPFAPWMVCPHDADDGCGCRKPAPGMVVAAARRLGVDPRDVAVIGDTGADVAAAQAAGARGILVPNAATRWQEIADAPETAPDIGAAVDLLLESAA